MKLVEIVAKKNSHNIGKKRSQKIWQSGEYLLRQIFWGSVKRH